jgi:hypothetical protein
MEYHFSKKEMAAAIRKSPRFVSDMCRGGFRLPATVAESVIWLRDHPYPTRNRKKKWK